MLPLSTQVEGKTFFEKRVKVISPQRKQVGRSILNLRREGKKRPSTAPIWTHNILPSLCHIDFFWLIGLAPAAKLAIAAVRPNAMSTFLIPTPPFIPHRCTIPGSIAHNMTETPTLATHYWLHSNTTTSLQTSRLPVYRLHSSCYRLETFHKRPADVSLDLNCTEVSYIPVI